MKTTLITSSCIVLCITAKLWAAPFTDNYQCRNVEVCRDNLAEGLALFRMRTFGAALDAISKAMDACGYQKELRIPCRDPTVTYAYAIIKHQIAGCPAALEYYRSAQVFRKNASKGMQRVLETEINLRLSDPACAVRHIANKMTNAKPNNDLNSDRYPKKVDHSFEDSQSSQGNVVDDKPLLPSRGSQNAGINCDFRNMKIENKDGIINLCGTISKVEIRRQQSLLGGLLGGAGGLVAVLAVVVSITINYEKYRPPPDNIFQPKWNL